MIVLLINSDKTRNLHNKLEVDCTVFLFWFVLIISIELIGILLTASTYPTGLVLYDVATEQSENYHELLALLVTHPLFRWL